jgi:nucleotide-binding universal stress UspA family protein
MGFKDILVLLDDHRNYESRLEIALSFARQDKARLAALYGLELPPTPSTALSLADAIYVTNDAARTSYERERDAAFDNATHLEAAFRRATARAGVAGTWEVWPEKPKDLIGLVTTRARYADLIVVGQADPGHPLFDTLAKLPEEVMLGCGRPVLIVPYAAQSSTAGKRILIAWNGSREAARAVADALPLLQSAETVIALSIGTTKSSKDEGDQPARRLVEHLTQHAVRAESSHCASDDLQPGETILSRAADLGCDLIVMGGYGHSRTRELILGGVTRAILQNMTVPVLMSH